MLPLLAELDPQTISAALIIGVLVLGLSSVSGLAVSVITLFRMGNGKDGERQIEPTALHALQTQIQNNHTANQAELKAQTATLTKLDRESGETKMAVESLTTEVSDLKKIQREDVDKMHIRVGGISRELSGTTARVDGLEKREHS